MLAKQFYLYIENVRGVVKMTNLLLKFNGRYSGKNNSIPSTNISSNKYVFINSVNLHQD